MKENIKHLKVFIITSIICFTLTLAFNHLNIIDLDFKEIKFQVLILIIVLIFTIIKSWNELPKSSNLFLRQQYLKKLSLNTIVLFTLLTLLVVIF